jgi:hypothetical protein
LKQAQVCQAQLWVLPGMAIRILSNIPHRPHYHSHSRSTSSFIDQGAFIGISKT